MKIVVLEDKKTFMDIQLMHLKEENMMRWDYFFALH